jgi:hypothetical protein
LGKALNTYYLHAQWPSVSLLPGGRPGTTRVAVELRRASVSAAMPVVAAHPQQGLSHTVVSTWRFLQVRLAC